MVLSKVSDRSAIEKKIFGIENMAKQVREETIGFFKNLNANDMDSFEKYMNRVVN